MREVEQGYVWQGLQARNLRCSRLDGAETGTNDYWCSLDNSTGIRHMFEHLQHNFNQLFRRKDYMHHQQAEGMDEMEFTEAESNMNGKNKEFYPYFSRPEFDVKLLFFRSRF